MEIEKQFPILDEPTRRRVRIAEQEMPTRMGACIRANASQQIEPSGMAWVIFGLRPNTDIEVFMSMSRFSTRWELWSSGFLSSPGEQMHEPHEEQ